MSGRLSHGFNHTPNVHLALQYYKLAWDGLQESRLKEHESLQIEMDSMGKIKQFASLRNPVARGFMAKIMEKMMDKMMV